MKIVEGKVTKKKQIDKCEGEDRNIHQEKSEGEGSEEGEGRGGRKERRNEIDMMNEGDDTVDKVRKMKGRVVVAKATWRAQNPNDIIELP